MRIYCNDILMTKKMDVDDTQRKGIHVTRKSIDLYMFQCLSKTLLDYY